MEEAALPALACSLPCEHGEWFDGTEELAALGDHRFVAPPMDACANQPTCVAVWWTTPLETSKLEK